MLRLPFFAFTFERPAAPARPEATRLLLFGLLLGLVVGCGGGGAGGAAADATAATAGSAAVARVAALAFDAGATTVAANAANWTTCANEGQMCAFTGTKQVRYGAGSAYVVQTLTGGTACTNAVFGDPAYGVVKSCAYADFETAAAPGEGTSWTLCAKEGGVCTYSGSRSVRFGTSTQYVTAVLTGPVDCTTTVFGGDPASGVVKSCWYGDPVDSSQDAWIACATEGGRCAFTGTRVVRYGSGTTYALGTFVDGVGCSNAVFGDPLPNLPKACSYSSIQAVPALPARSRYVGTNLAGVVYYGSNFPFADLMKSGGGWTPRQSDGSFGGTPFPSVGADGTPTALAPGQHGLAAVAWAGSHYPAGRYVVLWDGDGSLSFPLGVLQVVERTANRIVVETAAEEATHAPMWVSIDSTSATNPVRNVRFLWPGTESTYLTQPFNPAYLQKIAPFSMVRFMDWGATNGSSVKEWADRAQVSDASYAIGKGVPIERMIDLANTLRVDPWFCIPHQASDDYVRRFAQLLHTRLDPALRPHVEYSNEVWNFGFAQTQWALAQSAALGLDRPWGTPSIFYAKRSVEIFDLMRQVYGAADAPRLVRVMAGQAAWTQFLENALAYRNTAANADVMAIAPYFGAPTAVDPANVASTLQLSASQVVDQMIADIRGPIRGWMQANAALAARYRLTMKAYEGGAGDTLYSFAQAQQGPMVDLYTAAHTSPRMAEAYAEYYDQWIAAGGDALLQYNDIGAWSVWGFWGLLQHLGQDSATSPKYKALLDTIARHPTASASPGTAIAR